MVRNAVDAAGHNIVFTIDIEPHEISHKVSAKASIFLEPADILYSTGIRLCGGIILYCAGVPGFIRCTLIAVMTAERYSPALPEKIDIGRKTVRWHIRIKKAYREPADRQRMPFSGPAIRAGNQSLRRIKSSNIIRHPDKF